MRNTFKILFYVKRKAPLRNGELPIMGRITIDGRRAHFSTRLSVPAQLWESASGRAAGRSVAARRINERLSNIRFRIETCYESLFAEQALVSPQRVKARFFGADSGGANLLAFFRQHNDDFARMVGVSRSKGSYYKYRCVYLQLAAFIRRRYGRDDLPFRELDRNFLVGFHAWIL
ncbi:MAG: phage integrase SAM-like domain-containing protein, partial [Alistipes sp.]|nr:phage integrase SAM-like domain-containing protein [Alistipes sp.]